MPTQTWYPPNKYYLLSASSAQERESARNGWASGWMALPLAFLRLLPIVHAFAFVFYSHHVSEGEMNIPPFCLRKQTKKQIRLLKPFLVLRQIICVFVILHNCKSYFVVMSPKQKRVGRTPVVLTKHYDVVVTSHFSQTKFFIHKNMNNIVLHCMTKFASQTRFHVASRSNSLYLRDTDISTLFTPGLDIDYESSIVVCEQFSHRCWQAVSWFTQQHDEEELY